MSDSGALKEEQQTPSDTNNNTNGSSDSGGGGADENNICRDYQRGVCNRGGKCKFRHPEGMGIELQSPPMICRDYQNGKCNRSTCKYMHISNDDEKVYLRTGVLPPRARFSAAPMPPAPMMRPAMSYPHFGHPTRAGRSDPICKDFLNNKCSRGNLCKFRHAFEDDKGYGGGYGGPMDDFSRKRRRDSSGEGGDYLQLKDENERLHRQVADLQKQISDLKATNEVLLEQNARYRNQANSASSSYYSGSKSPASSSYPPRDTSYNSGTYSSSGGGGGSSSSYGAGVGAYNANAYNSGSASYTSGTGYTKFE
ncbi:predicted protein [Nematostella vectensis]|uniref:C3H1-type domain-containing protein n=1 Tax=Nematostella vectensis TaxID=45351 RepID=A7S573_NEMVE|nr:zinc finger CCCH domain-containing protein 10 [Nematostella vectensis]EDO41194.1 predicted protein [Nematostella vectensis]|eukprot:XP_001633257.1 predicted protein [Nematostella vectensis]